MEDLTVINWKSQMNKQCTKSKDGNRNLQKVTHNFKRDATRSNCAKVNYICTERISRFPKQIHNYFLRAIINPL